MILRFAYLDDALIYSNSEEEHVRHVKWIMQRLLEAGLHLKPEKCEFRNERSEVFRVDYINVGHLDG
jgi:hypothetical protein